MGVTFEDFWKAYPQRKGCNPRKPAEKKFKIAIETHKADPAHLVSSARKYAEEAKAGGTYGTEFVCMAQTWLNQQRWLSYAPDQTEKNAKLDEDMAKRGYRWNGERWEKLEKSLISQGGENGQQQPPPIVIISG